MASDTIHEEITNTTLDTTQTAPQGGFFPAGELDSFRTQWSQIQANFVDEPKRSVEEADQLVDKVIQRVTQVLADDRSQIERELEKSGEISTEDLRLALRRYRTFFDRLLSI